VELIDDRCIYFSRVFRFCDGRTNRERGEKRGIMELTDDTLDSCGEEEMELSRRIATAGGLPYLWSVSKFETICSLNQLMSYLRLKSRMTSDRHFEVSFGESLVEIIGRHHGTDDIISPLYDEGGDMSDLVEVLLL
jgi:hypothetical protein